MFRIGNGGGARGTGPIVTTVLPAINAPRSEVTNSPAPSGGWALGAGCWGLINNIFFGHFLWEMEMETDQLMGPRYTYTNMCRVKLLSKLN